MIVLGLSLTDLMSGGSSKNDPIEETTETGYWGTNGYYDPSKEEMDQIWEDVYDWIDKTGTEPLNVHHRSYLVSCGTAFVNLMAGCFAWTGGHVGPPLRGVGNGRPSILSI